MRNSHRTQREARGVRLIHSFSIAFSMYSRIPVPQTEWDEADMRYVMCFFPLIGLVIGALLCVWAWLADRFNIGNALFAGVATVLPVAVTGGIHLDGFCDTMDALGSRQAPERKLEILKDSNSGAFAVIGCCLYFLLNFCLWLEWKFEWRTALILAIGFVCSRALSGLSVVHFPCAKNSGLLAMFSNAAEKKRTAYILLLYLLFWGALMLVLYPFIAMAVLIAAFVVFGYYHRVAKKEFGGITGDVAGWFLQICELMMLAAAVIAQKVF